MEMWGWGNPGSGLVLDSAINAYVLVEIGCSAKSGERD
jgi:hypothetical protein